MCDADNKDLYSTAVCWATGLRQGSYLVALLLSSYHKSIVSDYRAQYSLSCVANKQTNKQINN
jgi:hypothetical protein